jgi:F like protein
MAEEFEYDEPRIEALLAQASVIFRQRFRDTVRQIQASFDLTDIEQLIAERRFDEALVQVELAATNLSNAYVTAYVLAGEDVFEFISNSIGIQVNFDQVNERAVAQMRAESLRLIREFTEGQRAATRTALVEGVIQGLNPRDQARLFRQSIGLTANQMRAVANFRRLLESNSAAALARELRDRRFDPSVRRAVSGEKPLTAEQIDRMVQRYYERSLAARAETIARTESLAAVHQASDEGFRQAIENGLIDEELTQKWRTAGDGRVREPSHTLMNGQTRPFGQPFRSGTGNLLRYPGDNRAPPHDTVRCRCVKTTRFTSDVVQPVEV